MDERTKLHRRDFLLGSAGAVGAGLLGTGGLEAWAEDTEPRVRRYVPLGRTGMKVADISFGSSRSSDPELVRYAYERGVNYFDSAEGYQGRRLGDGHRRGAARRPRRGLPHLEDQGRCANEDAATR